MSSPLLDKGFWYLLVVAILYEIWCLICWNLCRENQLFWSTSSFRMFAGVFLSLCLYTQWHCTACEKMWLISLIVLNQLDNLYWGQPIWFWNFKSSKDCSIWINVSFHCTSPLNIYEFTVAKLTQMIQLPCFSIPIINRQLCHLVDVYGTK